MPLLQKVTLLSCAAATDAVVKLVMEARPALEIVR
jgi:hypothetical protein